MTTKGSVNLSWMLDWGGGGGGTTVEYIIETSSEI